MLFDKDGTLSHSEPYLLKLSRERINQSIALFKPGGTSSHLARAKLEDLLSKVYGVTSKEVHPGGILAVASKEQNLTSTATIFSLMGKSWPTSFELAQEAFHRADECLLKEENQQKTKKTTLLPGARAILKSLKQAGVLCALISNDNSAGIKNFLKENDLEQYFCHIWSAENNPKKPDPIAVQSLCNEIGLHPNKCALIGDANSDLKMALQANVSLILGYISGWSNPPKLSEQQFLIHHWEELTVLSQTNIPDNFNRT